MLTIKAKYIEEVIGESWMVRLFVATAHANIVLMGQIVTPPIKHTFRTPSGTVLPDGEEGFSDDEGEEWKDR